jgi:hypothetical protein
MDREQKFYISTVDVYHQIKICMKKASKKHHSKNVKMMNELYCLTLKS